MAGAGHQPADPQPVEPVPPSGKTSSRSSRTILVALWILAAIPLLVIPATLAITRDADYILLGFGVVAYLLLLGAPIWLASTQGESPHDPQNPSR